MGAPIYPCPIYLEGDSIIALLKQSQFVTQSAARYTRFARSGKYCLPCKTWRKDLVAQLTI